jgi:hypothetical protein
MNLQRANIERSTLQIKRLGRVDLQRRGGNPLQRRALLDATRHITKQIFAIIHRQRKTLGTQRRAHPIRVAQQARALRPCRDRTQYDNKRNGDDAVFHEAALLFIVKEKSSSFFEKKEPKKLLILRRAAELPYAANKSWPI